MPRARSTLQRHGRDGWMLSNLLTVLSTMGFVGTLATQIICPADDNQLGGKNDLIYQGGDFQKALQEPDQPELNFNCSLKVPA